MTETRAKNSCDGDMRPRWPRLGTVVPTGHDQFWSGLCACLAMSEQWEEKGHSLLSSIPGVDQEDLEIPGGPRTIREDPRNIL